MPHSAQDGRRGIAALITGLTALALCAACSAGAAPSPAASDRPVPAVTVAATIFATRPPRASATTPATTTPAPTPSPTPDPALLERAAQEAAFIGDYPRAIALEQQALTALGNPQAEAALRGQLRIGQWQLAAGEPAAAIATVQPLADLSGSPLQNDARVLLGRALEQDGQAIQASAQFSAALASGSILAPWLNLWIGDDLVASSQPTAAVPYLQSAVDDRAELVCGVRPPREAGAGAPAGGRVPGRDRAIRFDPFPREVRGLPRAHPLGVGPGLAGRRTDRRGLPAHERDRGAASAHTAGRGGRAGAGQRRPARGRTAARHHRLQQRPGPALRASRSAARSRPIQTAPTTCAIGPR